MSYTLKTHVEFLQAFGEVPVEVEFDYSPEEKQTTPYPGSDASVDICSARLYSNGRWIDLDREEASNLADDMEDRCMEFAFTVLDISGEL